MNTRKYHGLLCAAMLPPVGRIMAVNRIGEVLTLDDKHDQLLETSINTFRDGIHPRGDRYLTHFTLDDTARWEYDIEGVRITKEVQMPWMKNTTAVRYTVDAGSRQFRLRLLPFVSLRDFHDTRKADSANFKTENSNRKVSVGDGYNQVTITSDTGAFDSAPDWWYGHIYPIETERGQGNSEDLYMPGSFVLEGRGKATITLWMGMDQSKPGDWDGEIKRRKTMVLAAGQEPENVGAGKAHTETTPSLGTGEHPVRASKSDAVRRLFRASNDFVVYRKSPDGSNGTTVIAGYPWFADWGRDTMISLPGLFLVTGRFRQAREVLCLFAQYTSEGMIPNRFDDYTNDPCYNTVDASLWFIHAVFEYTRMSKDTETFETRLLPACKNIIDGYTKGTRFGIRVDPADGLITQGDAHTQLTWMDAKCGNIAFTPRQGKPVEINALWYHALVLTGDTQGAARVAESFKKAFWISPSQGLADVVEGDRKDMAIRPNQIFAVSLPNSPLDAQQQAAVVDVVRRELLTPVGLRTLSRGNPGYRGRYSGDQFTRDGAYHNGTVWPWPIGAFLDAYLKVNKRSSAAIAQAREWLSPLIQHMSDTGAVGEISEIFEGDEPHRPVGCPAQAWSIAEVLRLAVELEM